MSVSAYTAGTVLGGADSRRTPAFRVLALGLLGMDRCGGSGPIPLRGGFSNAAASQFALWQAGLRRPAHTHSDMSRRHEQKHLLHHWSDCRYRDRPQTPRAVLRIGVASCWLGAGAIADAHRD